jgi:hypothetical protein
VLAAVVSALATSPLAAQDPDLGGELEPPTEFAPGDPGSAPAGSRPSGATSPADAGVPMLPVTGAPPPVVVVRARDPGAPVAELRPEPPPVTTVGGRPDRRPDASALAATATPLVTAGDVVAAIEARPPMYRAAYADPAAVHALVVSLARDRVLARAARAAHLDEEPRVRAEIDAVLARAFERRALESEDPSAIDAAAVRAYYDAHLADYTRPEMVRVAAVVFGDRHSAERALAELRADRMPARRQLRFRALATTRSIDGRLRRRRGDLGWVYPGGRADPALVAAVMPVAAGDLVPEVLEFAGRYYVLRVTERRAPEPVPFERARVAVSTRMREERRRGVLDALFARLAREQGLRILGASGQVAVQVR